MVCSRILWVLTTIQRRNVFLGLPLVLHKSLQLVPCPFLEKVPKQAQDLILYPDNGIGSKGCGDLLHSFAEALGFGGGVNKEGEHRNQRWMATEGDLLP